MTQHKHEAEHGHHEPRQHTPSKFSLFKHRVADVFKDIVEAPPIEKNETPTEIDAAEKESGVIEHGIRITAETTDAKEVDRVVEVEELDEDATLQDEREKTREMIHEHIVGKLNSAVAQWKETGNIGVNLEPPVPLKDKVKLIWSRMKEKGTPLAARLKQEIGLVAEKVSSRLKRAEQKGEKTNSDELVKDEWQQVLKKMESASPSERDEIEKIYKELSGE